MAGLVMGGLLRRLRVWARWAPAVRVDLPTEFGCSGLGWRGWVVLGVVGQAARGIPAGMGRRPGRVGW